VIVFNIGILPQHYMTLQSRSPQLELGYIILGKEVPHFNSMML